MQRSSVLDIDSPGPWFVWSLSGPLSLCNCLRDALRKAHDLSGKTSSLFHAPSALIRVGTNERLDAHQIVALWRELDFPVPV